MGLERDELVTLHLTPTEVGVLGLCHSMGVLMVLHSRTKNEQFLDTMTVTLQTLAAVPSVDHARIQKRIGDAIGLEGNVHLDAALELLTMLENFGIRP